MAKICVVTCYNQPDYIRAKTLRAAAERIEGIELIVVKNKHTGLLRYGEVFFRTLFVRMSKRPDVYILTFRGYEMLLPIRLLTLNKPLIYDELVNPIEWVAREQRQVEAKQTSGRLYSLLIKVVSRLIVAIASSRPFAWFYRSLIRSIDLVLADTESHAEVSAELTGVSLKKFLYIPVGTDEAAFNVGEPEDSENELFTVFYYGNMLPLHGLKYVINAAVALNHEAVKFVLIGGNAKTAHDVARAIEKGANIDYKAWVEFEQLPRLMRSSDLCLAGPFGNTFQAQYVITGKAYQYLAMGRAIVIGKNKESKAFQDKKDALIVPQANAHALAETIRWAMNNRDKLKSIGLSGQALYKRSFSIEQVAKRLKLVLDGFGLSEARPRTEK